MSAEMQQYGFLEPLVHYPPIPDFFSDPQMSRVEPLQAFGQRFEQSAIHGGGGEFLTPLISGIDDRLQRVSHGAQWCRCAPRASSGVYPSPRPLLPTMAGVQFRNWTPAFAGMTKYQAA